MSRVLYEVSPVYPEPRGEQPGCSRTAITFCQAERLAKVYQKLLFKRHPDMTHVHVAIYHLCYWCKGTGQRPDRPRQKHTPCSGSGLDGSYTDRYVRRRR